MGKVYIIKCTSWHNGNKETKINVPADIMGIKRQLNGQADIMEIKRHN